MEMTTTSGINLKITQQTTSSISLHWDEVVNSDVYKVERNFKANKQIEYWGRQTKCKIINLQENFCHKFCVFALKFENNQFTVLQSSDIIKGCTLPNIPTTISIQRAVKKSQEYLLKRYLTIKSDLINIPGSNGMTPLANAVVNGNRDLVEIILNNGADVNLGNLVNRRSPLQLSMFFGRIVIAKLLLDHKADRNLKDCIGLSFVHYAIDGHSIDSVKFIVTNNVNYIEETDPSGWTMLLRAIIMKCNVDILQILLENNANLNAMDKQNQTPLDIAILTGQDETVKLLKLFQLKGI